jgi:phosphoribosylformylglycinamidine synthase subunit PurL
MTLTPTRQSAIPDDALIEPTDAQLREVALTRAEFEEFCRRLGRRPTAVELGICGAMWSEHCGYKNSRPLLRRFRAKGMETATRVLVGAGEENAGAVDVGDGLAAIFKIESHNHPSAVEPFQGAATGVGGIVRDIFTMGARPIATLDSLRFGPLDDPDPARAARNRYLFEGVVGGVGHYSNCLLPDEAFIWRDGGGGVHFDTIGQFAEARLKTDQWTAAVPDGDGAEALSVDLETMKTCWRPVRHVFRRRAESLVRVTTALGRSVTATADHPMVVRRDGRWVPVIASAVQAGDVVPLVAHLPAGPGSDAQEPAKSIDLIEAVAADPKLAEGTFVALPAWWRPTLAVRSALRSIEPSVYRRHDYLKAGRLPWYHFRVLEPLLGVSRTDLRLFRRSGRANYMRAVIAPDEEFARLLGYYLAEGCVTRVGNTETVVFTFARHETQYVCDVIEALKALGLKPRIYERDSTTAIYATSWLLGSLLRGQWGCGAGSSDKAAPSFVFQWPRALRRAVLKGLLRGDGSLTVKSHGSHAKIAFATASPRLFDQILVLLQDEGAVPSVYAVEPKSGGIGGRSVKWKRMWHLEVSNVAGLRALADVFGDGRNELLAEALANYRFPQYSVPRFTIDGDIALVHVRDVEAIERPLPHAVYDVEIEGTHLFATSGSIVTHNCIGVPNAGGEVVFAKSYGENPLVNAMCVGIARAEKLVRARASGPGNSVLLVGADTGRDGLHGATFASVDDPQASHRGVVQVGDPFREKLLIEACLEVLDAPWLVGMQDLGAAGLTSSTVECASKGESGIEIDVAKVSRRETGLTAYEVMLSESQERMLVIVKRGHESEAQAVFARWGLHSDVIGQVTDDQLVRVKDGDRVMAELPHTILTEPPQYVREGVEAAHIRAARERDLSGLPVPDDLNETLLRLLAAPNIASKRYVFRRYDTTVQSNTVVAPGGDAAVLRLKGTKRAIAVKTDGNGRYCYLDPLMGGRITVAEAARNVSCTGAQPLAATDCLNFGNPEKPAVYYQLQQCIEGMAQACEALGAPVISGNVSLYNESAGEPIYPTPIVGVLGLLEDAERRCTSTFKRAGDVVALLGETREELGASEYLERIHGLVAGHVPQLDLDAEHGVQAAVREAIARGLLSSAHDCSDGGLAVALAECCTAPDGIPADDASRDVPSVGVRVSLPDAWRALRPDAALFGESQSRIVVSLPEERWSALEEVARRHGVPLHRLGLTGGDRVAIEPHVDVALGDAKRRYETGLVEALRPLSPGPSPTRGEGSFEGDADEAEGDR